MPLTIRSKVGSLAGIGMFCGSHGLAFGLQRAHIPHGQAAIGAAAGQLVLAARLQVQRVHFLVVQTHRLIIVMSRVN